MLLPVITGECLKVPFAVPECLFEPGDEGLLVLDDALLTFRILLVLQ